MYALRKEVVGKRFLCVKERTSQRRNSRSSRASNPLDYEWQRGIIRASTEPDYANKDLKVLVEFEGQSWDKREWLPVYDGRWKIFLLEKALVWAQRTDPTSTNTPMLWPALAYFPLVDKHDLEREKYRIAVEFFGDRHLEFVRESSIRTYQDDNGLQPALRKNVKVVEELELWQKKEKSQTILLEGSFTLTGHRVRVYRQQFRQWFSAVITAHNLHTRDLSVMDDTVLETHSVNPTLVQIILLATDTELDSLQRGEILKVLPMRQHRHSNVIIHTPLATPKANVGTSSLREGRDVCNMFVPLTQERGGNNLVPLHYTGQRDAYDLKTTYQKNISPSTPYSSKTTKSARRADSSLQQSSTLGIRPITPASVHDSGDPPSGGGVEPIANPSVSDTRAQLDSSQRDCAKKSSPANAAPRKVSTKGRRKSDSNRRRNSSNQKNKKHEQDLETRQLPAPEPPSSPPQSSLSPGSAAAAMAALAAPHRTPPGASSFVASPSSPPPCHSSPAQAPSSLASPLKAASQSYLSQQSPRQQADPARSSAVSKSPYSSPPRKVPVCKSPYRSPPGSVAVSKSPYMSPAGSVAASKSPYMSPAGSVAVSNSPYMSPPGSAAVSKSPYMSPPGSVAVSTTPYRSPPGTIPVSRSPYMSPPGSVAESSQLMASPFKQPGGSQHCAHNSFMASHLYSLQLQQQQRQQQEYLERLRQWNQYPSYYQMQLVQLMLNQQRADLMISHTPAVHDQRLRLLQAEYEAAQHAAACRRQQHHQHGAGGLDRDGSHPDGILRLRQLLPDLEEEQLVTFFCAMQQAMSSQELQELYERLRRQQSHKKQERNEPNECLRQNQEQKQSKASSQVTAIHTKFAESKSGQAPSTSSSLVCPNGSLPATSAGSLSMRAPLAQPEAHTKESLLMLLTQNQGSARNTAVVSSAPASWPADSPVWLDSSHSTQTEKLRPAQPAQATASDLVDRDAMSTKGGTGNKASEVMSQDSPSKGKRRSKKTSGTTGRRAKTAKKDAELLSQSLPDATQPTFSELLALTGKESFRPSELSGESSVKTALLFPPSGNREEENNKRKKSAANAQPSCEMNSILSGGEDGVTGRSLKTALYFPPPRDKTGENNDGSIPSAIVQPNSGTNNILSGGENGVSQKPLRTALIFPPTKDKESESSNHQMPSAIAQPSRDTNDTFSVEEDSMSKKSTSRTALVFSPSKDKPLENMKGNKPSAVAQANSEPINTSSGGETGVSDDLARTTLLFPITEDKTDENTHRKKPLMAAQESTGTGNIRPVEAEGVNDEFCARAPLCFTPLNEKKSENENTKEPLTPAPAPAGSVLPDGRSSPRRQCGVVQLEEATVHSESWSPEEARSALKLETESHTLSPNSEAFFNMSLPIVKVSGEHDACEKSATVKEAEIGAVGSRAAPVGRSEDFQDGVWTPRFSKEGKRRRGKGRDKTLAVEAAKEKISPSKLSSESTALVEQSKKPKGRRKSRSSTEKKGKEKGEKKEVAVISSTVQLVKAQDLASEMPSSQSSTAETKQDSQTNRKRKACRLKEDMSAKKEGAKSEAGTEQPHQEDIDTDLSTKAKKERPGPESGAPEVGNVPEAQKRESGVTDEAMSCEMGAMNGGMIFHDTLRFVRGLAEDVHKTCPAEPTENPVVSAQETSAERVRISNAQPAFSVKLPDSNCTVNVENGATAVDPHRTENRAAQNDDMSGVAEKTTAKTDAQEAPPVVEEPPQQRGAETGPQNGDSSFARDTEDSKTKQFSKAMEKFIPSRGTILKKLAARSSRALDVCGSARAAKDTPQAAHSQSNAPKAANRQLNAPEIANRKVNASEKEQDVGSAPATEDSKLGSQNVASCAPALKVKDGAPDVVEDSESKSSSKEPPQEIRAEERSGEDAKKKPKTPRNRKRKSGTGEAGSNKKKKKDAGTSYLIQEGCCTTLPNLPKCRECRDVPEGETPGADSCRFNLFRRLKRLRDGTVEAAGFHLSDNAKPEEFQPWVSRNRSTFGVENSMYILKNVGKEFCNVVQEEVTAISSAGKGNIAYKRAVQGLREMCDTCDTTIFNAHWVCEKCGFGVCLDCYNLRVKERKNQREHSRRVFQFKWMSCGPGICHQPKNLTVAQMIPQTILSDLEQEMHKTQVQLGIGGNFPCEKPEKHEKQDEASLKGKNSSADAGHRPPIGNYANGEDKGSSGAGVLDGEVTAVAPSEDSASGSLLAESKEASGESDNQDAVELRCEERLPMEVDGELIDDKPPKQHTEVMSCDPYETQSTAARAELHDSKEPGAEWKQPSLSSGLSQSSGLSVSSGLSLLMEYTSSTESSPHVSPPPGRVGSPDMSSLFSGLDLLANLASIASERASEMASERASERLSEWASELASERASEMASERASDLASERASERTSERASEITSERALELMSEQASERASELASERASGRASELASEPASTGTVEAVATNGDQTADPVATVAEATTSQSTSVEDVRVISGTQAPTTSDEYPAPHTWFCDGRLLRLLDNRHPGNLKAFESRWKLGEPVLVSGVHKDLNLSLWTPDSFGEEFGSELSDVVNCRTGMVIKNFQIRSFWTGFESIKDRPVDHRGDHMLLKLKDWPPGADFSEKLPTRFEDLMNNAPLPEYTRRDGCRNLASRIPPFFATPDLGPKMYNAYGSAACPKEGTTNLHLDMSDAVNVMVYVGVPKDEGAGEKERSDAITATDKACDEAQRQRVRDPATRIGALWHIYAAEDADKIRALLHKVAKERKMKYPAHHDPIHDQCFYLDSEIRRRLKEDYGVEGWAICQCLGDAVFIPAGAPHQVRNLHSCVKVAEDFVSPEHISHCFRLTQEFRYLSSKHTNHEDKLQVKNIIYHAVKDAVQELRGYLQESCPSDSATGGERLEGRQESKVQLAS